MKIARKNVFVFLIASLVFLSAGYFSNVYISPVKAQSTSGKYLTGYAWSDNIGWISFATSTYNQDGVSIDSSGNISGYAWSDNIGWIKFGGLSVNFPSGSGTQSQDANINGNNFKGWARAYSPILDTQTVTVSVPSVSTTTVVVPSYYKQTGTTTVTETFDDGGGCGPSCQQSIWSYWIAPAGVTSVTAEVWGSGGGASGFCNEWNDNVGAGGGGGYSKGVYSVIPGNSYDVLSGSSDGLFGPTENFNYNGYVTQHPFLWANSGGDGQCGAYNQDIEIGGAGGAASGGTISNLTGQSAYKTTAGASGMPTPQLYGHGEDSSYYNPVAGLGGYPGFVKLTYNKPIYTFVATSTTVATTTTYSTTTSQISVNGWDGWISLSGNGYGVSKNTSTNNLTGYAWGSDVLGWIDFSGVSISDVNANGVCGSSNLQTFSSAPSGSGLCSVGQSSSVANPSEYTTYTWSCLGTNGVSDMCHAQRTCGTNKTPSYIDGSCVNTTGICSNGYTSVNGQCVDSRTTCTLDGITLENGGSKTFYKSSISSDCGSGEVKTCTAGTLSPADSVYVHKKCVSPKFKEF